VLHLLLRHGVAGKVPRENLSHFELFEPLDAVMVGPIVLKAPGSSAHLLVQGGHPAPARDYAHALLKLAQGAEGGSAVDHDMLDRVSQGVILTSGAIDPDALRPQEALGQLLHLHRQRRRPE